MSFAISPDVLDTYYCGGFNPVRPVFDLVAHLYRQKAHSEKTFGPGDRTKGILDHIRKELKEIEDVNGQDLEEWIDVIILACDAAWRSGHSPEEIVAKLQYKQTKNENREWPDWRTQPIDKAIEHVRT
jgi:hypothetical protein